jgi:AcrR family transcriptional regulator
MCDSKSTSLNWVYVMPKRNDSITLPTSGQRGPAEHERREQIISAADELFREFSYTKTSVADIAKALGISTAYVYRFFKSKQAIGEVVCAKTLEKLGESLMQIVDLNLPATRRLRQFMEASLRLSYELIVVQSEVNEVVVAAIEGNWCTISGLQSQVYTMIERIVDEGRRSGEFDKRTPLDEITNGIAELLMPYLTAHCLAHRSWEDLEKGMSSATSLALRSLAS